jgi:hypothetical protein
LLTHVVPAIRFLPDGPGQSPGQPVTGRRPAQAGPGRIAGPFYAGHRDRVVYWKLLVHNASPLPGYALGLFWYLLVAP